MNDTRHLEQPVHYCMGEMHGQSASVGGRCAASEEAPAPRLDRRQRKTRQAIHRAFESLMSERHYSAVTVVQIIERADIGRSTFYAHFETKEDLLDDMCADMFGHVFEGVTEFCGGHADLRDVGLAGKLAHLLYHLRDSYSGVCGKLIAEGEPHFTTRFKRELETLFTRESSMTKAGISNVSAPTGLLAAMQASAFMEAVTWWLAEKTPEASSPPEQIATWFCQTLG